MPTQAPRTDSGAPPDGVPRVVAVVVAHQGARWLPALRAAVTAQTTPMFVVAADTGSSDGSVEVLSDWLGPERVVALPAATGYGDAVRAALTLAARQSGDRAGWIWLLHDDCAPAPDALEQLLAEVTRTPRVAIAGPKVRSFTDRRLLLEIGVTISRGGRRDTLLERGEYDQGQHDGTRDVLSVGTAGMLVRADVWTTLGGLDRRLPLLRDDVDLGWRAHLAGHRVVCVPDAVLYHAEATSRRRRQLTGDDERRLRLYRLDRQHALYVLLANLPLLRVPFSAGWLALASLVRAVGLLVGKRPWHALDELSALVNVLGRPDLLIRARRERNRTRAVPARRALRFLAPRSSGFRHALDLGSGLVGTGTGAGRHRVAGRLPTSAPATGPTSEEDEGLPAWSAGVLRWAVLRPSVGMAMSLLVLTMLACRGLVEAGRLQGGALLPAPSSVGQLWTGYIASWHPVGLGSDAAAPPYLAVLGILGAVLGGAERAVTLLLLGAVPLSGVTAYLALRPVVASRRLRVWAATSYALLPAVLATVAAGRLGTAVVAVLLPLTAMAVERSLALRSADRRDGGNRATWSAVLLLAVMASFVPMVWVLSVALALAAALVLRGRNLARLSALVLGPPLLLAPWLPAVFENPRLLVLESGLAGPRLADPDLSPARVLLLSPGGPGTPPLLLTVPLVVAAVAGLLRPDRRRPVVLGWVLALTGLSAAAVLRGVAVTAPASATPVPAWPGPAMLLAGAGLVLAAVGGAQGARERISRSSFGWRQLGTVLLAGLAVASTVALAGWWVLTGADGPLARRDPVLLPAFVAAEGDQPDRPRTLVLKGRGAGNLSYALLRSSGPRTGDAEVTPSGDAGTGLDEVVADLTSGRGGDAAARLVPYGVRFVLLSRPVDRALARAVDSVPGMVRVSGQAGEVLWRVDYRTGRLRLLDAGAPVVSRDGAPPPARVVRAGNVSARTTVPEATARRLLVLADPRDAGWRARLDGQELRSSTYDGWAQAFVVPAGSGGHLEIDHGGGMRTPLLWLQAGLVLLAGILLLPEARWQPPGRADGPLGGDAGTSPGAAAALRPGGELR